MDITGFNEIINQEDSFCEMSYAKTYDKPVTNTYHESVPGQLALGFIDALIKINNEVNGQIELTSASITDDNCTIQISLKLINGLMSKEIIRKTIAKASE